MNQPQAKLLNAANILTLIRFPASPLILLLILQWDSYPGKQPLWIAIGVSIIGLVVFLSDLFDGRVARKYKIVSDFGKIMDPIADSTFFVTLLFAFSASPRFQISIWFPILVFYREVAVQAMRRFAAARGAVMAAGWSGKLKMVIQSVAMGLFAVTLLLNDSGLYVFGNEVIRSICFYATLLIIIVNWGSLLEYMVNFSKYLKVAAADASTPNAAPAAESVTDAASPVEATGTDNV